jgi:hypothetical protein
MEAMADLLAEGADPEDVTLLAVTHRALVDLVNESVAFHLIADNVDQPDAAKYGIQPGGSPAYAPQWYMAQQIKTAIHEGLYGVLSDLLKCESVDEHGHRCTGSLFHDTNCWDGNGCNWVTP